MLKYDPVVTMKNLLKEYERLCDLFCFTPEKHWQWRDAKAYLEEVESKEKEDDTTTGNEAGA